MLSPDADDYVSFFKSFYAIDMAIHSRESFADSGSFFALLPGYSVNVYLTPSVVISDEIVRSLPVSQRNCLFENEVQSIKKVFFVINQDALKYFFQKTTLMNEKYSYSSCMTDCRVRAYIKMCNCIPFYFPHIGQSFIHL